MSKDILTTVDQIFGILFMIKTLINCITETFLRFSHVILKLEHVKHSFSPDYTITADQFS